jgi:hypothetical protein
LAIECGVPAAQDELVSGGDDARLPAESGITDACRP